MPEQFLSYHNQKINVRGVKTNEQKVQKGESIIFSQLYKLKSQFDHFSIKVTDTEAKVCHNRVNQSLNPNLE